MRTLRRSQSHSQRRSHEILLAVRKLCSFAMEHDKKWSSSHNKRKYRVSQLYSQLLEMVRIDALRDHEHVRVVSASATLPTNRKIVDSLLGSMNNMNPGGEPRNPEARRQLMFFSNSLNFTNLKAPCRLKNMRSWTAFTPYYAEEVSYSKQELTRPLEDQKTLLSLIQATYPDEYENFKERVGLSPKMILVYWRNTGKNCACGRAITRNH